MLSDMSRRSTPGLRTALTHSFSLVALALAWATPALAALALNPPPPTHPDNQHARDGALVGPVRPFDNEGPAVRVPWREVTVIEGLEHPWAFAFLPSTDPGKGDDGLDLLITERPGRLRLVQDGVLHPEPLKGVPEVFAQRQGGLLDVALHPDFGKPIDGADASAANPQAADHPGDDGGKRADDSAVNRWVYLTWSKGTADANGTAIGRGRLDLEAHALVDFETLFEVEPKKRDGFHFGSRIVFLPQDGTLLFSVGEGARYAEQAQDPGSYLGKVLRIRPDGSQATDNPLHARIDAAQEVYSFGHRNIQGMAVHPVTGDVWATEHGARGGDELNLIRPGENYGWPEATYSHQYNGPRVSKWTSLPDMIDPEAVWTPCIAPSGLAFYTGAHFPEWQGDLFAGGLVLRQIRRVPFNDDGSLVKGGDDETFQFRERIRDVRQGPDGYLYVITDEPKARLFRIERGDHDHEAADAKQ